MINFISNSEKNNIFNIDSLENINRKVSNEIQLDEKSEYNEWKTRKFKLMEFIKKTILNLENNYNNLNIYISIFQNINRKIQFNFSKLWNKLMFKISTFYNY